METLFDNYSSVRADQVNCWFEVAPATEFPPNGGVCIRYKGMQIAVFNFTRKGKWYATQNLCPHKMEMVLSRGLIGDAESIPKVACPLHKRTFSLESGENLNGSLPPIATYPVKVEQGVVFVGFKE
ncbi:MAG: nitrite reductase small subunit NirD [Bacteroidota bacterium]